MLRLGSPGKDQLDLLPGNVTGVPPGFQYHPFRFLNWKEEAWIQKKVAQQLAEWTTESQCCFYIDYSFMRVSYLDYSGPNKKTDRVVLSYDGFSSYLLIIVVYLLYLVLPYQTKEPPINLLDTFFSCFGHKLGGSVCTNQGGELACSGALTNLLF